MVKASERATDLTRQLLAFSRRQGIRASLVDLNALVRDMDRMLRRVLGEDIEFTAMLGAAIEDGARRSWTDRTGDLEYGGECPRRNAGRR